MSDFIYNIATKKVILYIVIMLIGFYQCANFVTDVKRKNFSKLSYEKCVYYYVSRIIGINSFSLKQYNI